MVLFIWRSKIDWDFMQLACRLGADPRMWLPEQLARTPNAEIQKSTSTKMSLHRPTMNTEQISKVTDSLLMRDLLLHIPARR